MLKGQGSTLEFFGETT